MTDEVEQVRPKIGWRAWGIPMTTLPGEKPKLYSIVYNDYYWRPYRASQAVCGKHIAGHVGSEVPVESCGCGFYSAKTLEHFFTMTYRNYDTDDGLIKVIGKVSNWGKVIEGDLGWRAQISYPLEFLVPYEGKRFAKALRDTYGVPVRLKNFLKEFKEFSKDLEPEDLVA